ncbi:MAG: FAD:protein transferase [Solirubrobacteraceae bacterium]|nr:FAD:protein transferase [Solirubrobacteraceae bacterium]
MSEAAATFACFGAKCSVRVLGDAPGSTAAEAVEFAQRRLLGWHQRFTRFDPGSELSRLNADPAEEVRVSAVMAQFVEAVIAAARHTNGLVDATLLHDIEAAGYRSDLRASLPLEIALGLAPARRPAAARPNGAWHDVAVDRLAQTVTRPPGVAFDSGGIAKGLLADILGRQLAAHRSFAVDCAGDLLLGGTGTIARNVDVASPFGDGTLERFALAAGGVATSGIGRRSWLDADGRPAHHLLDPATGRPAFTGIVQVTALAPLALTAEIRSKAALLSGPDEARDQLPDGGVIVYDDGRHELLSPRSTEGTSDASFRAAAAA